MINISTTYEIINTSYIKSLSESIKRSDITSQFKQNIKEEYINSDKSYEKKSINEKMNLIIDNKK
jgi:hypothetical protein